MQFSYSTMFRFGVFVLLQCFLLSSSVNAQVEHDVLYEIYDNGKTKFLVQFSLPVEGEWCEAASQIDYAYRYQGQRPHASMNIAWSVDVLQCNDIAFKFSAVIPGVEFADIEEEEEYAITYDENRLDEVFKAKEILTEPAFERVESSYRTPKYVPIQLEESRAPEAIRSSMSFPVRHGESIELSVDQGVLGKDAEWIWYKGACGEEGTKIGIGESITITANRSDNYFVRAESPAGSSACASLFFEVDRSSKMATAIEGRESVCEGWTVKYKVQGGALGPDSDWYWYRDACGSRNSLVGKGNEIEIQVTSTVRLFVRAETNDHETYTGCIEKEILVERKPKTPEDIEIVGGSAEMCEGESIVFRAIGELSPNAYWVWTEKETNEVTSVESNSIRLSPKASTDIILSQVNPNCGSSGTKDVFVDVYKKSIKPDEISVHKNSKGKVDLLAVVGGYLAEESKWVWYREDADGKRLQLGVGAELPVSKNLYGERVFVRAEGKKCADETDFVSYYLYKTGRSQKERGPWSIRFAETNGPWRMHLGFELGVESFVKYDSIMATDVITENREEPFAGSGGYFAVNFSPFVHESFFMHFRFNGGLGGATAMLNSDRFVLNDTTHIVDYSYRRIGFGMDLGTRISGGDGPVKFLIGYFQGGYNNDYNVVLRHAGISFGKFQQLNDRKVIEQLKAGFRFGSFERAADKICNQFDLYFLSSKLHNGSLFNPSGGWLSSLNTWNPGIGMNWWMHGVFKLQLEYSVYHPIHNMFDKAVKFEPGFLNFQLVYRFDLFH